MKLKDCRKAFVAFGTATITAYVAAWAQAPGSNPPGWITAGSCALLGVIAGLSVFGVRNGDKPAPYVPVPGTSAATMATRAATRSQPPA